MMALMFGLLLITVITAWVGKRHAALILFAITLICSVVLFVHHVTSHLTLQL